MRLSIEITREQHQCLKAAAALEGKSLKAYVLERALLDIPGSDNVDLVALEKLLKSRIRAAEEGAVSDKSVEDIFDEAVKEESLR